MTQATSIDVCICTFRRTHIAVTLRSLAQMELPEQCTMRVIVADNDVTPSAQVLVSTTAEACGLNVTYVHAPARNISIARNACLDAATADYIAFMDDDEIVSPQWLAELLACARETGADAVLGPMQAMYSPESPAWVSHLDFHSTRPAWVKGRIITGYTTNSLLRRTSPAVAGLRFREAFGVTGGEDTMFFGEFHRAGGTIAYAENALSYETVPPERATLRWLMRRRYRSGETHAKLLLETGKNRLQCLAAAGAKAVAFFALTPLMLGRAKRYERLLRGTLQLGILHGLRRA